MITRALSRGHNLVKLFQDYTVEPLVYDPPISEKKGSYNGDGLLQEEIFSMIKHFLFNKT